MYAGRGIEGDKKIAVSNTVNSENRIPDEIKALGHAIVKRYIDERIILFIESENIQG